MTQSDLNSEKLREVVKEEVLYQSNENLLMKTDRLSSMKDISKAFTADGSKKGFVPGPQELDVKVYEKLDSTGHPKGYFNQVRIKNKTRLQNVLNGMQ